MAGWEQERPCTGVAEIIGLTSRRRLFDGPPTPPRMKLPAAPMVDQWSVLALAVAQTRGGE